MHRTLLWVLLSSLVAAPVAAEESEPAGPKNLLILEFKHEEGAGNAQNARLINDLVAGAAERTGKFKVITGADIANAIELEAERETLGCDTSSASCLAEVAGAMGAELVLFGNVGRLGDVFLVTLNLFNSNKAQSAGRESVKARELGELPDKIDAAVARLLGVKAPPRASASGGGPSWMQLGGIALAGVGVAGAGTFYTLAALNNEVLADEDSSASDKQGAFTLGHVFLWSSVASAALAAGGVAMIFMDGGE